MTLTGSHAFVIRRRAPVNISLPAQGADPAALQFDMVETRSGVPGIVNPGNTLSRQRDWQANYTHPTQGFAGVRWCPSWIDTKTRLGAWEPATGDVYRIRRKGTEGTAAQTLLFDCGPNPAAIPAGEPVVLWQSDGADSVLAATSLTLAGYNIPLKSKLTVSASIGSAPEDANGRRIVEVFTGTALPAIDFSPVFFSTPYGDKSPVQIRHWAFYKNTATKELRQPINLFAYNTNQLILPNGGHVILGGNEFVSATYDWSKEYINFGATLASELFRLECEGLAHHFGASNPRKLAVELENRVVHPWGNVDTTPGYRNLLSTVFYPLARTAWGNERTIIVKPSNGIQGVQNDFDWPCPVGHLAFLAAHETSAGGKLATLASTDALAEIMVSKINQLGYAGGGLTSVRVLAPETLVNKGLALGNTITSFSGRKLFTFYASHIVGADPATTENVADVFIIDGNTIEALFPEMRQRASRSGLVVL